MATVKIEKFIDGKHETTFTVPFFLLRLLNLLMPGTALRALTHKGINVAEILAAGHLRQPYSTAIHVRERGIDKKVVVSLA